MQSNSTAHIQSGKPAKVSSGCQKPEKPYPEFPLFPHASKRWAKKVRGQMCYFGSWADGPDAALAKYLEQKDELHSGRKPRQAADDVTIKDLVNAFLNHKTTLVQSGELKQRSWEEYKDTTDLLIEQFGKRRLVVDVGPDDFAALRNVMGKRWGLHRIAKNIQYVRSVFKFGFDSGLIDRPVRFGPGFARPSKKAFRIARAEKGANAYTAEELRTLIDAATPAMKAMLLLAINAGFGNDDCARLPIAAIDLDGAWMTFPRPKTGIERRAPLWPETVKAIREWLAVRPSPKDPANADLLFITAKGNSWSKESSDNPVSKEMVKLQKQTGINQGRTFYSIRHTFRTIADRSRDQRACALIMGHGDSSMAGVYVEMVDNDRLFHVSGVVREWLFSKSNRTKKPNPVKDKRQ